MNVFGTDGIRGEVDLRPCGTRRAIDALVDDRRLTLPLAWLAGQAVARTLDDEEAEVVIGWDDRPGNPALVHAVHDAFSTSGWGVTLIGPCATPLVHHVLLERKATAGVMITASHNPVEDSGLKVFDAEGRKSTPELEVRLTRTMLDLAQEDHDLLHLMDGASATQAGDSGFKGTHAAWLDARTVDLAAMFPETGGVLVHESTLPLLLDVSRGSAIMWLPAWLEARGLNVEEVSHMAPAMNRGCGAGELAPGARWTWDEAAQEDHLLLRHVRPAPEGTLLGAALDGDGDRCLLLVAEAGGPAVVDGDAMALRLLEAAATDRAWTLAASIESDLALTSRAQSMAHLHNVMETAVGDRWLAVALTEASRAPSLACWAWKTQGTLCYLRASWTGGPLWAMAQPALWPCFLQALDAEAPSTNPAAGRNACRFHLRSVRDGPGRGHWPMRSSPACIPFCLTRPTWPQVGLRRNRTCCWCKEHSERHGSASVFETAALRRKQALALERMTRTHRRTWKTF